MRPARGLCLAAAIGLVAVATAASGAPQTPVCGERNFASGAWVTLTAPPFPIGPEQVVDFVVAPRDPRRVYVTNGASVLVSRDGGCTWTTSYQQAEVPGLPVPQVSVRVMHLAMGADPDTAYAALGADAASRPRILRTRNGGGSWVPADTGLELVQGIPLQLVVAPSRPESAYLVVEGNRAEQGDISAEVARSLYATVDGQSWEQREAAPLLVGGGPVGVSGNADFTGVTVDPRNAELIWLYGDFGLWRSTDGGTTSQQFVPQPGTLAPEGKEIGAVDVFHAVTGPARILAFSSLRAGGFGSFNDGRRFTAIPTPGIVRSSATGRRAAELALATDSRVFYQADAAAASQQITPPGPPVRDLQVSVSGTPVFYARSATSVLRWTAPPDPVRADGAVAPVVEVPGQVSVPQLPPLPVATLRGPAEVTVPALGSLTVPYTLDLPGVRRVDVFFLVDVSDSMEAEIAGLRSALAGIVTELVASNIDAWFGVGRYNTYGTEPYLRVTPVIAPGPRLATALESLVASSGGTDKSQLEAVYQAASGPGKRGDDFIPAGQQAGFRAGVPAKLILNVTDEAFFEGEPSPSYDTVTAALRKEGVLQLGLALDDDDVLPTLGAGPEVGLRRLAAGSGALAPAGGVDCNGDAEVDIAGGEPLVCVMPSTRTDEATLLANAIVSLVRSLPNTGRTEFAVTPTSAGAPVPATTTASFDVDFTRAAERSIGVTFTCPGAESAEHSYRIGARAGTAALADIATVVRCTAEPAAAVARLAAPAAAAGLPNPPPPPTTVTHGNPNPNANPNPNPQAQAQGQAGMAGQEQDEAQLAYAGVHTDDAEQQQAELAMSGLLPRQEPAALPAAVLAAVVLAGGAGLALRHRSAPASQQVRVGH